jgi:hypothetical protein
MGTTQVGFNGQDNGGSCNSEKRFIADATGTATGVSVSGAFNASLFGYSNRTVGVFGASVYSSANYSVINRLPSITGYLGSSGAFTLDAWAVARIPENASWAIVTLGSETTFLDDINASLSDGVIASLKCKGSYPITQFGYGGSGQTDDVGMFNVSNPTGSVIDVYAELNRSLPGGYSICMNSSSVTDCTYLSENMVKVIDDLGVGNYSYVWAYWNCTNANFSKTSYAIKFRSG